ncbi:polypeptide N-acetylgalactosaminyltransferase 5 [Antennarius striatus]|uniref:polypeptide N-acetylgalactosaminyltransferase 5 n=1 Tax=Antennarius striatus TaxID=241820 RepID=UPI0035ADA4C7
MIRRYLRGSGRVLASVFVASVVWLLFDMAALRLSINDVNSKLLKEQVIRERQLFKQQSRKDVVKKGDQSDGNSPLNSLNKVAKVYRQGVQNPPENHGDRFPEVIQPNHVLFKDKQGAALQNVTVVMQEERNLHVNGIQVDKSKLIDDSNEVMGNKGLSDIARVTPGVQDGKGVPSSASTKGLHKSDDLQNFAAKTESKTNAKIHEELFAKETHPADKSSKPNGDLNANEVINRTEDKQAGMITQRFSKVTKETPSPAIKLQAGEGTRGNATTVIKAGVHKVLSLDVTQSPRDSNAVGQYGQAAHVASEEDADVKKRWDEGHFNVYLSDKIPVDRAIPDTRPEMCAHNLVHNDLPSTSVIFCFVDEVWSTLLRSVHSVLNRSPPHLLKDIILVDDFSTKDYLKEPLDTYMSQFPKVRIIRLKERQGLIRARLAGAAVAEGEVLTFLDSHIECNVGWLEPLLERIYQDRKKVPCPVIEVISDKDMSYMLVDNFQRGVFKWPLVFGWSPLPEEYIKKHNITISDPIRCPVMAGGLFSIDRQYFYELGAYDPGLEVWGGENMEISFKIWMCGGEIEILPCSRVGHIFRGQNPYSFPKDRQKTVERNLARVAEVWLDEYKVLFYGHGYQHLLDKNVIDIGNLTEQIELRKRLQCKNFNWYLKNVYPDMDAPLVKAKGLMFNVGLRKCLTMWKNFLIFDMCNLSKQTQLFNYTWMRQISQKDVCIAPQGKDSSYTLQPCNDTNTELRWSHKSSNAALENHLISEFLPYMCLEAMPRDDSLQLNACEPKNAFQKWQFTQYLAH